MNRHGEGLQYLHSVHNTNTADASGVIAAQEVGQRHEAVSINAELGPDVCSRECLAHSSTENDHSNFFCWKFAKSMLTNLNKLLIAEYISVHGPSAKEESIAVFCHNSVNQPQLRYIRHKSF
jgi:hypothetical protein